RGALQREQALPSRQVDVRCYLTFARMPSLSFLLKARMVWLLTLPSEPSLREKALTVSSLGASSNSTTSYAPIVQNESVTFAPIFSASAVAVAARLMVSLTLRIPCSVNRRRLTYIAIFSLLSWVRLKD